MLNWELGRWQHFCLIICSHLSALTVLIWGSVWQIFVMICLHLINFWISGTVTYHRLLSHRSWESPRWFEIFGTYLGVFSFTGSSITRTIVHRQHHIHSDTSQDPHSPWHANYLELYFPMLFYKGKLDRKLAHDLFRDKFHIKIHRYYLLIILSSATLVFFCNWVFSGDALRAMIWMLAIIFGPGTFSWLTIYMGNLLCHLGKKNEIEDHSRNSWLIVLIGFGEGWHYNHHKQPKDPNFGHGKWDPGWWMIKMISKKQGTENVR